MKFQRRKPGQILLVVFNDGSYGYGHYYKDTAENIAAKFNIPSKKQTNLRHHIQSIHRGEPRKKNAFGIKSVSYEYINDPATYMDKPIDERQAHLDMSTDCDFEWRDQDISCSGKSYAIRRHLGKFLGTGDVIKYNNGTKIESAHAAHYCHNGPRSHEIGCKNVLHIYWATRIENYKDTCRRRLGSDKTVKFSKTKMYRSMKNRIKNHGSPAQNFKSLIFMDDGHIHLTESVRGLGKEIDPGNINRFTGATRNVYDNKTTKEKRYGIIGVKKLKGLI